MISQTISHYKVLEKLGEGGMGVVYKVPKFPASVLCEQMEFRGSPPALENYLRRAGHRFWAGLEAKELE